MASSRRTASLCSGAVLIGSLIAAPAETEKSESGISIAAAKKCELKLKKMEDFLEKRKPGGRNTTRFSEKEANSYLAYNLSKEYHPSLKKLVTAFKKNQLQIAVSVDFDRIGATSNKLLPKIMGLLLSGTHTIDAQGKLVIIKCFRKLSLSGLLRQWDKSRILPSIPCSHQKCPTKLKKWICVKGILLYISSYPGAGLRSDDSY